MKLNQEEELMREGKMGRAVQKAIELQVAIGDVYGAEKMIPISYAHVIGADIMLWTTGKLGAMAREYTVDTLKGANQFVVNSTINPYSFKPDLLRRFGYPQSHVDEMKDNIDHGLKVYKKLGVIPTYSCTPFLSFPPRKGEHIAAAETNVQLYCNSVLSAMTNRESTSASMAAALTGRTPYYGLHIPENRFGKVLVGLKDDLNPYEFTCADYSALSYYVAGQAIDKIPVYVDLPQTMSVPELLFLSGSHSQLGSFSMFHVVGVTPEAPTIEAAFGNKKPVLTVEVGKPDIDNVFQSLCTAKSTDVDWVLFGCPHTTLQHVIEIASLLKGHKINDNVKMVIGTSEPVKTMAKKMGLVSIIEAAGGYIEANICTNQFLERDVPKDYHVGVVTTDRAGAAHMFRVMGVEAWFGSIGQCVRAAITGKWEGE